ncbi:MAG: DEAD/DEAH box helicase [Planctomycetaceae bacterium]|nr:DEAD/DEAH box helicase [Planctomycetaceae bacterium]
MPQESQSNENNKKSRFSGRRRSYVDTFRWGFVPEDASSKDAGNKDAAPENTAEDSPKKRTRKKTAKASPVKKTTATTKKTVAKSAPAKVAGKIAGKRTRKKLSKDAPSAYPAPTVAEYDENDEDLKLPSYGRTPVPTDDELPQPQPRTPQPSVPRKAPTQKMEPKAERKSTSPKSCPATPPAADPPVAEVASAGFRPRREQMVWDPDRATYVPLVVPPKTESTASKKQASRKQASKKPSESAPNRNRKAAPHDSQPSECESDLPKADSVPKPPSKKKAPGMRASEKQSAAQPEPAEFPVAAPPEAKQQKRAKETRANPPKFVKAPQPDPTDVEAEASGFVELGVSDIMLEALRIVRYLSPTPIQAGVFKMVRAGTDLMGQARTGTGKTAAFSMPIIEGITACPPGDDPVAIILVPTRELAVQVRDEAMRLAYGQDIRITACYGGKPLGKQIERLKAGIDILVGTPGRILDLMNRRALSLGSIRWVVLDEADRMLDIGFRPDIEKILKRTPQERQTLLFSATLPAPVVRLAEKYMKSPEVLDFSNKSVAVDTIEQFYVTVDPERKFDALVYLLEEQQPQQAIIFTRTKRGADRLARLLDKQFDKLAAIHGDMLQTDRDRVMSQVRAGTIKYLVATDVVGRGIDLSSVSHIINYDIPKFCDDYVHRVGRTGRMGRDGIAYTFVTVQEGAELTRIEMRIDKLLQRAELRGFESFTKPHDPNASLEDEEIMVEPPKPVFGKPVRKVRRAL